MTVRCKFRCECITSYADGKRVSLVPVTCGSKENETFFKWTPFGKFEMGTISDEVAAQFIPGKEYYIDITLAEA